MGSPTPSMFSEGIWRLQLQLRKNSMVLPGLLLLLSSALVLHEHMTSNRVDLRTFLTLVLATMVPLAYIDSTISARSDPIGLLCKFGGKVLLMHTCFLLLRFRLLWYNDVFYLNLMNVLGCIASALAVAAGFHPFLGFAETRDVACIVLLAIVAAVCTELVNWGLSMLKLSFYRRQMLLEAFGTASEYGEILAFVPAVWTVFRAAKKDTSPVQVKPEQAKAAATAFFAFLMGFYLFEDAVTAVLTVREDAIAALAHVLHFLLLGDVTVFLLISAWNPNQANTTVLQRFSDAWMGECDV